MKIEISRKPNRKPKKLARPASEPVPEVIFPMDWKTVKPLARFMSYCSELVYEPLTKVEKSLINYSNVRTFCEGGMEAVGFIREGYAVIVFRGTTLSSFKDLQADLTCWRIGEPGRHKGFARGLEKLAPRIHHWLKSLYSIPKGIITSGHSMGGALAILAAEMLQKDYPIKAVITFGAPRTGGREFARHYRNLQSDPDDANSPSLQNITYRYEMGTDLFTWIVPRWLGYRHVGRRIWSRVSVVGTRTWIETDSTPGCENVSTAIERSSQRALIPDTMLDNLLQVFKPVMGAAGGVWLYVSVPVIRLLAKDIALHSCKLYALTLGEGMGKRMPGDKAG